MTEAVKVKGFTKAPGRLCALGSLDLAVEEGAIHGPPDPNGSGKPTTVRCLLGPYHPDAETVRALGMDPSTSAHDINRRVACVPDEIALWPNLTGQQILDALVALRGRRDEARECELIGRFRLDPSERIRTHSKGSRQKVIPVAALSTSVDPLVPDGPTSGLDPPMKQIFGECIVQAKAEGRTVLLSSHVLGEVQALCSHVIIIRDGVTVETSRLDRLKHLGVHEIRVRDEESWLKSLFADVESRGVAVAQDEGDVVAEADAARVPAVPGTTIAAGSAGIT